MSDSHVREILGEDFDETVIKGSHERLVLVDFWAPWCGPCRSLTPVLERLAVEYGGRFLLVKVNADDNQSLCIEYGVRGIPSVKAFSNGVVVDEFSGALGEGYVRDFLERNIPSPASELVTKARQLAADGKSDEAQIALDEALKLDPENGAARVEKAALLLDEGQLDAAAELVKDLRGDILDYDRTQQILSRIRLSQATSGLPDEATLKAAIEKGEDASRARLDLATLSASQSRYEDAMEVLLEVLQTDPSYDDGAARKRMLELFDVLGGDHALVQRYRRAMANLLH